MLHSTPEMMMKIQLILATMLFGWSVPSDQWVVAQGVTETIAKTGDATPDGINTFLQLGFPRMNDSGMISFTTLLDRIDSGDRGIFNESGGVISQIARTGQTAPDGNGLYSSFSGLTFNDAGQNTFIANLSDTSGGDIDDHGIFFSLNGTTTQVVREGQSSPNGNGTFANFHSQTRTNNSGTVVFDATFRNTSGGFDDDRGIYRFNDGSLTQVVREGQDAFDGNGTFRSLFSTRLNNLGDVAFYATLNGTSGGTSDNAGIFLENNGTTTQIARNGEAAPDGNGTFSLISSNIDLNNNGSVAFLGTLTGTTGGTDVQGLFVGNGSNTNQLVRDGQAAPDGNGLFSSFSGQILNDSGTVAFVGTMSETSGGTSDDRGIFTTNGSAVSQIVREGQMAIDGNGKFSGFIPTYNLNETGVVAFVGILDETNNGTDDQIGMYIGDGIDLLQIARKGNEMHGSTVSQLLLDNHPSAINRYGQVAYLTVLNDGSHSVNRYTPDLYWRTSTSGDWSDSSNWTLGLNPEMVHDVYAQSDSNVSISGPATGTIKNLFVGSATGTDLQGQVSLVLNGSNLNAQNNAIVNSTGTVTVSGDSALQVGNDSSNDSGPRILVGDSNGHGTLSVLGGGSINNEGTLSIGAGVGFTGHAHVDGAGSTWSNDSTADIGLNGTGTLTVSDGGTFINQNARVGFNSGGNGTVTITGPNSRWQSSSADLGSSGNAELVVTNGGIVSSGSLTLGRFGDATATVSGDGSKIEEVGVGAGLRVGWGTGGNGSLLVEDGAIIDGHSAQIATERNSVGSVVVTGQGSTWQNGKLITLGSRGEGTIRIENGGRVFNESSTLASISSGVANATVTGTGSSWIHERSLTVGGSGTASLNISDNALVKVDSNASGFVTSIGENGSVNLDGGQFEFGRTDFLGSYSRISGSSGTLEGDVIVAGDRTINSLDDYSKSNLDTQRVRHGNGNLITGGGDSQFGLTNFSGGELRTEAGEIARFGGLGSSNQRNGLISNQGGSVIFDNDFRNRNAGDIVGHGLFSFGTGLINEGTLNFAGGDTMIHGSVVNENAFNDFESNVFTGSDTTTTFTGSVVHNGNRIETEAGSSVIFEGAYSGAGKFTGTGDVYFEDLVSLGNSPSEVTFAGDVILGTDSEALIELGGLAIGEFDRFNISGDFQMDGTLTVEIIDGFALSLHDQFEIAEVDGLSTGQFEGLNEGDLVGIFGGFELTISYLAGDGNDVAILASASAVPEPGTSGLMLLCGAGLMSTCRRRRS